MKSVTSITILLLLFLLQPILVFAADGPYSGKNIGDYVLTSGSIDFTTYEINSADSKCILLTEMFRTIDSCSTSALISSDDIYHYGDVVANYTIAGGSESCSGLAPVQASLEQWRFNNVDSSLCQGGGGSDPTAEEIAAARVLAVTGECSTIRASCASTCGGDSNVSSSWECYDNGDGTVYSSPCACQNLETCEERINSCITSCGGVSNTEDMNCSEDGTGITSVDECVCKDDSETDPDDLCATEYSSFKESCQFGVQSYNYDNCIGECAEEPDVCVAEYANMVEKCGQMGVGYYDWSLCKGACGNSFDEQCKIYKLINTKVVSMPETAVVGVSLPDGEGGIDSSTSITIAAGESCTYMSFWVYLYDSDGPINDISKQYVTYAHGEKEIEYFEDLYGYSIVENLPSTCCGTGRSDMTLLCAETGHEVLWNESACNGECVEVGLGNNSDSGSSDNSDVITWLDESFSTDTDYTNQEYYSADDYEENNTNTKLNDEIAILTGNISDLKESVAGAAGLDLAEFSGLPVYTYDCGIFGTVDLDFNKYSSVLDMIGIFVMIVAYISAIYILIG